MPYFLVDGVSVYDRLRAPKFHLLTFSDGQSGVGDHFSDRDRELPGIESKYAHLVDHHIVPLYPHVAEIFGSNKSFNRS